VPVDAKTVFVNVFKVEGLKTGLLVELAMDGLRVSPSNEAESTAVLAVEVV
jgi:hypothetical protein